VYHRPVRFDKEYSGTNICHAQFPLQLESVVSSCYPEEHRTERSARTKNWPKFLESPCDITKQHITSVI